MLNSMFDIMARINELKSRFGINKALKPDNALPNVNHVSSFDKILNESSSDKSSPLFHSDRLVSQEEIEKIISFYSQKKGVSPDLVKALVKAGSNYNSEAVSPDGALGLMQLNPATADKLGITDPFNPDENVKGGITLLSELLSNYSGDYRMALEAYGSAGMGKGENDSDLNKTNYSKKIIDFYIKDSD